MAPSTPPPPSKLPFAALTIASTASLVMSPLRISIFTIAHFLSRIGVQSRPATLGCYKNHATEPHHTSPPGRGGSRSIPYRPGLHGHVRHVRIRRRSRKHRHHSCSFGPRGHVA